MIMIQLIISHHQQIIVQTFRLRGDSANLFLKRNFDSIFLIIFFLSFR